MPAVSLSPLFNGWQGFTAAGIPLSGGLLNTYLAGTSTPAATYTTNTGTIANQNPIQLDGGGRPPNEIWQITGQAYRYVLTDSTGSNPLTYDNIAGLGDQAATLQAALADTTNAANGAALSGYNPTLAYLTGLGQFLNYLHSRTAEETTAAVTPTNYAYFPGDPRRYGAVMDGVTDDSAAWAKTALVYTQGVPITLPPKQMMISAQVTFNPPLTRQGLIRGYGAELFTTGAISALRLGIGGQPHGVTVEGVTVNQRNNTVSIAAFECVGAEQVTFRDCVVEANNNPAGYGGFLLRNSTASDPNTGSFWAILENCAVRKRAGADPGAIPNAVILQGACNSTVIQNCRFQSQTTGILIQPEAGQTYMSNGVLITGTSIEGGFTNGILVQGAGGAATASGLRITGCRLENGTNFVSFQGATSQAAVPPILYGNYLISSVTNYLVNPNAMTVNIFDWSVTPDIVTEPALSGSGGLTVIPQVNGKHAFTAWASGAGMGYAGMDNNGNLKARWAYNTGPTGYRLTGTVGIAQSDVLSQNLAGTATFAAATTKTVTFANNEVDANYRVQITWTSDPGASATRTWVTGKGTTGFTVNTAAATSASFDWMVVHD